MADGWDNGSDWSDADWGTDDNISTPNSSNENEDWGSVSDSSWDSWDSGDTDSNANSVDDWDNQPSQSSDDWSSQASQSSDSWNQEQSISQSNADWGGQGQSTPQPNNNWNSSTSQGQQDYWANQGQIAQQQGQIAQQQGQPQQQSQPVQFNFGYKKIAIICALGFVLLALIFYFFDSIKINKNNEGSTQQQVQTQQTSNTGVNGSALADNTSIDYSGSIVETTGTVTSLSRLIQDNQLVYCINIDIPYGNSTITVRNYCNYSAYTSVNVGDMINVKYQVVNNSIISVNEISK